VLPPVRVVEGGVQKPVPDPGVDFVNQFRP
jgi:hypothetical protein